MIERLPDWENRLNSWLEQVRDRPFEWGRHDCALFAAGAVAAMTGHDFGAVFAGRYSTAAGAARALKRQGFADVQGPFTAALGAPVPPLLLRRGDIAFADGNVGVMLADRALFVGEMGTVWRDRESVRHGWAV